VQKPEKKAVLDAISTFAVILAPQSNVVKAAVGVIIESRII
jgi:hypothetical protein